MTPASIDRVTALFVAASALVIILACDGASSGGGGSGSGTASEAASVKVDAATILKDYEENEVAADNKYKDKVVEITGVVDSIGKDILDDIYVTIGTGAQFELPLVQCFVAKGLEDGAAKLQKGQKLTVTGRVDGVLMNVLVKDCRF
jgi:hypothetical protein